MPPRYSYWTILAGGLPTAFRAAERADLLPTFNRIREKHPDAEMKWFARGRLWASPEEAQADLQRERVRRDRAWRPGGDHRDPRQAFKATRRDAARPKPASQPERPSSRDQASRREQKPRWDQRPQREPAHQRAQRPQREQRDREQTPQRQQTRHREQTPRRSASKFSATDARTARPPRKRQR